MFLANDEKIIIHNTLFLKTILKDYEKEQYLKSTFEMIKNESKNAQSEINS